MEDNAGMRQCLDEHIKLLHKEPKQFTTKGRSIMLHTCAWTVMLNIYSTLASQRRSM